ncbi:MAG: deoxyribodipyrimidine photo-lyase [Gammaproteobacteria bacterium]|nr:deoxyribodipyrimidine photo-lyase [Gammaproteobacteria bacterium]NBT44368.1 deoxyribodipyrimidine photo-lyase [Gammaproteobacteria bacterium]NBY23492.1 deoxyribodipyrimidine photo-lyase [Gammaproteobacteria bacterium]NDE33654.1 deoxyribodipyrimidine photo-lyase [Gammaproteobacteria bacterium]NDE55617.1 deoxyribodipyrimidine photo-lyase [Gammaproteobacteria bacterium]
MTVAIVWFRKDLRLADQPALARALSGSQQLVPIYINDTAADNPWAMGSASRWWLHQSLTALDDALQDLGSRLIIRRGRPLEVLREVMADSGATQIYWNRLYTPYEMARDRVIKATLTAEGCEVHTFNSSLLYEPWEIARPQGGPYKVFTPFWKAVMAKGLPHLTEPAPNHLPKVPSSIPTEPLSSLQLLPKIAWDQGFYPRWKVGEKAAMERLTTFIDEAVRGYQEGRNIPSKEGTSRLSPNLHFGEISPRQIIEVLCQGQLSLHQGPLCFQREVGWREFGMHLLYHFPETSDQPLDQRFSTFPWHEENQDRHLKAWQQGQTGFPIVDAGMRELWHTGWMHNRVRMIVASLLCKNLLIDWRQGAHWFWDTLVDADLASNSLGWQWTAGCGADAAPYFRIFNPILQGEKFDPEGCYVRAWCPELKRLPDRFIHKPFEAPTAVLEEAGVLLGKDYPMPVVDLKESREAALGAFATIKNFI